MPKIIVTTDAGTVAQIIEGDEIGDLGKSVAASLLVSDLSEAVDKARQMEERGQ